MLDVLLRFPVTFLLTRVLTAAGAIILGYPSSLRLSPISLQLVGIVSVAVGARLGSRSVIYSGSIKLCLDQCIQAILRPKVLGQRLARLPKLLSGVHDTSTHRDSRVCADAGTRDHDHLPRFPQRVGNVLQLGLAVRRDVSRRHCQRQASAPREQTVGPPERGLARQTCRRAGSCVVGDLV